MSPRAKQKAGPTWARGFDVEELKKQARPFIESYRPHSYGAFGIPKEREIAAAREAGRFTEGRGGAMIWEVLERGRKVQAWTGEQAVQMEPGDAFVHDFWTTSPENFARRIGKLSRSAVWVEAHVENKEIVRALKAAGFRLAVVKIMASSDLKGVFVLRPHEALPRTPKVDALTLGLIDPGFLSPKELRAIRTELKEAAVDWAQHYSSYNKARSWTAFSLRGYYPDDPTNIVKPGEMARAWKQEHEADLELRPRWTTLKDSFPETVRILKRIPGKKDRVRFSRVAKGGELTRHADITDREAGTGEGKVARLHIPIRTNGEARFFGWSETGRKLSTHMEAGGLYYLDQRKPHAVQNGSGEKVRVHLIVDVFCNEQTREMLAAAEDVGK